MTGIGSSCGACKFLRRRCGKDCVFAPHFSYGQAAAHFAAVHKVFGASNVSKLLLNLPMENRSQAAVTISYEALARLHDPVYGCVAHIFALQNQVAILKEEIETIGSQMAAASHQQPNRGRSNQASYNMTMEQLAIWSHGMNLENSMNQATPFLHPTGNNIEPMAQLSGSDQISLQAPFGEVGPSIYLQNPWTDYEVAFN